MPYDPARAPWLKLEVLDRHRAGETLKAICADGHMPCTRLVGVWQRQDPWFRDEMASAKIVCRHRRRWMFEPAVAKEYVDRLSAGETVASLRRDPRMPSRARLRVWRSADPDFAAAVWRVVEARAGDRDVRLRHRRRDFDRRIADRILVGLHRGQRLGDILASDAEAPCYAILRRWRRQNPEFDRSVRGLVRAWSRLRPAERERRRMLAAAGEVGLRMAAHGLSLAQVAAQPDTPGRSSLYRWIDRHPEFADAVWRGCLDRDDWHMDRMLALAETAVPGAVTEVRRRMAPHEAAVNRAVRNRPGKRALAAADSPAARALKARSA
ncbi:hypothetical protein [Phenylobacterium sp.]|uniref:terminase small subunit-like protein n=1 Tax=Phenylobacterium sp. TaxID=1871053 RepID=UPI00301CCF0D